MLHTHGADAFLDEAYMPRSLHTYLFALLNAFQFGLQGTSPPCYWPNSSLATWQIACNSTAGGTDSACCDKGNDCTNGGHCAYEDSSVSTELIISYRGGCTDPSWASANCARHCKKGSIRFNVGICHEVTHTGHPKDGYCSELFDELWRESALLFCRYQFRRDTQETDG